MADQINDVDPETRPLTIAPELQPAWEAAWQQVMKRYGITDYHDMTSKQVVEVLELARKIRQREIEGGEAV